MKVVTYPHWYRFLVPIKALKTEKEEDYLRRTIKCLGAFWDKYTFENYDRETMANHDPFRRGCGGIRITCLIEEGFGYEEFDLLETLPIIKGYAEPIRRRFQTGVRLFVGTPQHNYGDNEIGIVSLANANKLDEQRQQVEFLKKLWRNFRYKP